MQKTINFNDFLAKKHEIVGLSKKEMEYSETFKYIGFILLIIMALALGAPFEILSGAKTAFLQF
jgi:hypothetical protein